jgi:hypothetical protein
MRPDRLHSGLREVHLTGTPKFNQQRFLCRRCVPPANAVRFRARLPVSSPLSTPGQSMRNGRSAELASSADPSNHSERNYANLFEQLERQREEEVGFRV